MENNTHEIILNTLNMPRLLDCDIITAYEEFIHVDRTADFSVLLYVFEGAMYVTEDETDYELKKGGLLFLKQGVHHFGKRPVPKGTRWFYAHFICEETSLAEYDGSSAYGEYSLRLPKSCSELTASETESALTKLSRSFQGNEGNIGWKKNIRLFELLTELALDENSRPVTLSDRIAGFLARNTDKPFTRELLEKQFFLSYSYMSSVFRSEKGVTLGRYHDKLRMKEACRLLRSTSLSVGEIAARTGFSDVLYFSRRFHELVGTTPTAHRRDSQRRY